MSTRNVDRTAALIVAVLLMASVLMIAVPVQPAAAQLAEQQPVAGPLPAGVVVNRTVFTVAALSFRPNPIGVGQTLLVNFWTTPAIPSNNFIHQGYTVTITKPDGTTDVRTMDSEPATAANWFEYIPTVAGNYTIKFEFAGEWYPKGQYYNGKIVTNSSGELYGGERSEGGSSYYLPSSTEAQPLTVQEDFVWSWPPAPLPTDYWTRPVSLNNREWWPILGAYPGTGYQGYFTSKFDELYPDTNKAYNPLQNFHPWVQGPNSAHILWKRLDTVAGLIGGPAGQYGPTSNPNSPNLVYAGRCYDTRTIWLESTLSFESVAVCTDLRTGEYYYQLPGGITPQYIAYIRPEASGETIAGAEIADVTWQAELLAISGSRLYKINPNTGALTGNYSISPLSSSGAIFHNQINGYVINVQDLGAAAENATGGRYRLINWTTRGTSSSLSSRIVSNTSYALSSFPSRPAYDFNVDRMADVPNYYDPILDIRYRVNCLIYRLSTGELLYNITTEPSDTLYSVSAHLADHGKIAVWTQQGYWICWDMLTGKLAWRSEVTDYPWSSTGFGAYSVASAYGMLFRFAYDGVYAFNWTDGSIVWHYKAPAPAHFESPYIDNGTEVYSFNSGGKIADGKLYVQNSEHTTTYPITRGWSLHCINITTGEGIWKINNPMTPVTIADGYLTASNSWDGTMYVFGKGKSTTTVTASPKTIAKGAPTLIEGSVLDMSPAQPGTPCVSQTSMEQQMEYLHLGQQIGGLWNNETITGVPVSLTAISSDGSFIDLGTATTNGYSGFFSFAWTPPEEGKYEIIATFAADESYGSSMSTTAVAVGPAPEPYPAQIEPEAPIDNSMLLYAILVLVVIAIIIGITALLRKR